MAGSLLHSRSVGIGAARMKRRPSQRAGSIGFGKLPPGERGLAVPPKDHRAGPIAGIVSKQQPRMGVVRRWGDRKERGGVSRPSTLDETPRDTCADTVRDLVEPRQNCAN